MLSLKTNVILFQPLFTFAEHKLQGLNEMVKLNFKLFKKSCFVKLLKSATALFNDSNLLND